MTVKFSAIIGNANTGHMLRMCLYSLMKYNGKHINEIIVSDNSSTGCFS
jgi:GT2 family glycosyltransferase